MSRELIEKLILSDGLLPNQSEADAFNEQVHGLLLDWDESNKPAKVDLMKSKIDTLHSYASRTVESQVGVLRRALALAETGGQVFANGREQLAASLARTSEQLAFGLHQAAEGLRAAGYTPESGVSPETRAATNPLARQRSFEFFVRRSPLAQACENDKAAAERRLKQAALAEQAFAAATDSLKQELLSLLEAHSQPARQLG